jgi:Sec-independent protein translocase protein TatA
MTPVIGGIVGWEALLLGAILLLLFGGTLVKRFGRAIADSYKEARDAFGPHDPPPH